MWCHVSRHVSWHTNHGIRVTAHVSRHTCRATACLTRAPQVQELPCRLDINVYIEHIRDLSEWSTYPNNAMRNRALALADTEVRIPNTKGGCMCLYGMRLGSSTL